tara:strand:- start:58546 stop:58713 length:168 start_codon:yes stop_codon:yes gene_type:complete
MEKEICNQCLGSKSFMAEGKTPEGSKMIYLECKLCDEDGMVEVEDIFLEDNELEY